MAMATTIQVSEQLLAELKERKLFVKETYEEVIWDLLEDSQELSEETKQELKKAEKDIAEGRIITHQQLKKELGLWFLT